MNSKVINVVFAGLGGQGVLKASDILAETVFRMGFDVKKAEVHGMSQRGGFVMSDVRFGATVLSPMIPAGEADILVVLEDSQIEASKPRLKSDGRMLTAGKVNLDALPTRKALNVAMLGWLSAYLDIPESRWMEQIKASLPPNLHEANEQAFAIGRAMAAA